MRISSRQSFWRSLTKKSLGLAVPAALALPGALLGACGKDPNVHEPVLVEFPHSFPEAPRQLSRSQAPAWTTGHPLAATEQHLFLVDRDNRLLYETWDTRCLPAGSPSCSWRAGSGAVFPLDANLRRPDGWTSADAAGLAILPGLVRFDEAFGSEPIRHAFRFTVRATNGYVFPASHRAGSTAGAPPMGRACASRHRRTSRASRRPCSGSSRR